MTNFDIFLAAPQFEPFASVAVSAERILHIDPAACVGNCRRAMELAVKWMYSVDGSLAMPYDDKLISLINAEDFRDIVGIDLWRRMDLIRKLGNDVMHTGKKSPGSRRRSAWKTCSFSWILSHIATARIIPSGILTARCRRSLPRCPLPRRRKCRTWIWRRSWQKTPR